MRQRSESGSRWLRSLVVLLVIFGLFALLIPPCHDRFLKFARLHSYTSHAKSILAGLRIYAADYEGAYPMEDEGGRAFGTSTEAFGHMMEKTHIKADVIFYVRGNPAKTQAPINDGKLTTGECSYSYASGQSDSDWETSPLLAQEMTGVGTFGENHPFLKERQAVVGYVGGHARIEQLSSRKPGATIPGPPGSGIDNIFEQGTKLEDGTFKGGFLAVPASNILHP